MHWRGGKNVVCSNEKYVGQWKMHHMQGRELQIVKDSNKVKSKGKQDGKGKTEDRETEQKQSEYLLQCIIMQDLKRHVEGLNFDKLLPYPQKTFCITGKTVDKNSLTLLPKDIPLKPKQELFPTVIAGDGNCLPHSASVLIYGTENKHSEMQQRIVLEFVKNECKRGSMSWEMTM